MCRLHVDLSMEKALFGGPYEWAVFAVVETIQLIGCLAVYPFFIVSTCILWVKHVFLTCLHDSHHYTSVDMGEALCHIWSNVSFAIPLRLPWLRHW